MDTVQDDEGYAITWAAKARDLSDTLSLKPSGNAAFDDRISASVSVAIELWLQLVADGRAGRPPRRAKMAAADAEADGPLSRVFRVEVP